MKELVCASSVLLLIVLNVYCDPMSVKQTTAGPIEGIAQTSSLGQKYVAFRGIPFASSPITGLDPYTGEQVDRRFKAPEPLKRKWIDNLIVHEFNNFCIPTTTSDETPLNFSEDCLFLNIYVPVAGADRKTVLVWIYGGGFIEGDSGDSLYGPDFLLSEDNIIVTLNYRLGIFGFLNLGLGDYTGNMGLKDQQLALKWVYENIENFSGKKDEILLFGESAGATSVNFHMLNVESRKYFNRAFLSSGSAFSYYAFSNVNHLDHMKNCTEIHDREKLIEFLKTVHSNDLDECQTFSSKNANTVSYAPTIENPGTIGAFKVKSANEMYNSDDPPVMDTLFSFTSQEWLPFQPNIVNSTEPLIKDISSESELPLPFDDFNGKNHPEEYKEALKKLHDAYFNDVITEDAIIRQNINLMSDMYFGDSVLKAVILQTKANNNDADNSKHKNTFLFRFSVDADVNLFKVQNNWTYNGTGHGEDVCYIFNCHDFDHLGIYDKLLKCRETGSSCVSYDVILKMVKIITNFARTGNPSIEGDTPFQSCESQEEIFCQEISNDPTSSLTANIKDQLHYDTWREIEQIYNKLQISSLSIRMPPNHTLVLLLASTLSFTWVWLVIS